MYDIRKSNALINLGIQGETDARTIEIDISYWIETYGSGEVSLLAQRNGETSVYPVEISVEGTTVIWTPDRVDTGKAGFGQCELIFAQDGKKVKSAIFRTLVGPSLDNADGVPDAYEDILQELQEDIAEARELTESAEAAAERAEEAASSAIKVKNMTVSVETLPPGSEATITKTESETAFDLHFEIPAGETGAQGIQGEPGTSGQDGKDGSDGTTFTPSVSAAGVISWTNDGGKTNPNPVDIKGPAGKDGKDGEDYVLTSQDKQDIADIVISELPTWTGGAY